MMTREQTTALTALCETYKLLASDDAITIITLLLEYDELDLSDLKILASIEEERFDITLKALVLSQLIDSNNTVAVSAFGKNVMKLTEEYLSEIRKTFKGQRSRLLDQC